MDQTLSYPNLMGATVDSLVTETHKTGQEVFMVVNYGPKETHFLFTKTLKNGPTIEASYTYKREMAPIHGLTRVFTAYYHLIKIAEQMSSKNGIC